MCQFSNKFFSAVRILAGDGPIKTRLYVAYSDHLDMLPEADMPDSIRQRFEILKHAMHTVKPASDESPILASVRKMSSAEAGRCATQIVAMFSELVRVKSTGERLRLKSPAKNTQIVVPEHLASLN
jgi:hypothetical protein